MDGDGGRGRGPADRSAATATTSGTAVPRVIAGFAAGVAVTVLATVLFAVFTPMFLPVAPVVGAGVAGYLARVGRVGGALLGAMVLAAVGTAALAGFWLVATADMPATGGAGVGLVVAFLFVALFGLFGVVLGGLGGLTGVVLRERRHRPDAPAHGDTPSTHVRSVDADGDPARPDRNPGGPDAAPPATDAGATHPPAPPADTADHGSTTRATHVLVGSGIAVATCIVPLAPVAAGFATGYLEADGARRGAVSGGLAGVVATGLLVGGLLLFASVPVNVFAPFIFEFLPELVVILAGYFVVLTAAGGAFGGSVAS